jgi:hypothetical protein
MSETPPPAFELRRDDGRQGVMKLSEIIAALQNEQASYDTDNEVSLDGHEIRAIGASFVDQYGVRKLIVRLGDPLPGINEIM